MQQNVNKLFEITGKANVFVVATAVGVARDVPALHDVLRFVKDGGNEWLRATIPPLDRWLRWYRRPDQLFVEALAGVGSLVGNSEQVRELVDSMLSFDRRFPDAARRRDVVARWLRTRNGRAWCEENSEFVMRAFKGWLAFNLAPAHAFDPVIERVATHWVRSGIGAYLLTVVLPCLVEKTRMPGELYQQAINGDWDALEFLLRIDKRILADHRINNRVSQAAATKRKLYERLVRQMGRLPRVPTTKQLKTKLAGWLSYVDLGSRSLNSGKQRQIFNLAASINSGRSVVDRDIPVGEDFTREIHRKRRAVAADREGCPDTD